LVHNTKNGKNVPYKLKMHQLVENILHIAIKYINIFQSKVLQNLPKSESLVWK
jgi:hypothetical protein